MCQELSPLLDLIQNYRRNKLLLDLFKVRWINLDKQEQHGTEFQGIVQVSLKWGYIIDCKMNNVY